MAKLSLSKHYLKIVIGLSCVLCGLLMALAITVVIAQPDSKLETTAEAEPNALFSSAPILDASIDSKNDFVSEDVTNSGDTAANSSENDATVSSQEVDASFASTSEASETTAPYSEQKPAEKIYTEARYLTAFLAIGRYQGLPGTQEIYEGLLDTLGIDFTVYEDLPAEIEAVTASLKEHPDIWQQTAEQLEAANILPAESK